MGAGALEEAGSLRVRAFFGLRLPDAQREALDRYLATCSAAAPDFRWTPAANLHLTVRFIGGADRALVDGIADRLGQTALAGFEVELGELGTFKRGRLTRVVWLGLRAGAAAAQTLAAQVEDECSRAGLAPEQRPFQPHLTLARARRRDGAVLPAVAAAPELEPWRAEELILYASHLSRSGAVYEPLRLLRLG